MLAQKTNHTQVMQTRYKYDDDELLSPERVRLYTTGVITKPASGETKSTKINTLIPAKIQVDVGIEVITFDTTIEDMNAIQSDILYGGEL